MSASPRGSVPLLRAALLPAAFLFLAAVAPLMLSRYWIYLVTTLFAYAVAILGLKVLFGECGQLSLGQAAFMALGSYTAAVSTATVGLTLPYEMALAMALCGAVAALVALPALRVSGLRFALVTLAFGGLVQWLLREAKSVTGGEQGLFVPAYLVAPLDGSDPLFKYALTGSLAVLVTLMVWHLPRTRVGRAMSAVRESEMAALSVGVSVRRTRFVAFALAGVLGGMSGVLLAHAAGAVSPITFDLFGSIYLLVGLILGGARSVAGAWIGAAYLVVVPEVFTSLGLDRLYVVFSGALLLLVVMVFPAGVVGLLPRRPAPVVIAADGRQVR